MADSQKCCFHISPQNDQTAEPEVLHCSRKRIDQLQRLSVVLKERIKSRGNCDGVPLEIDDTVDIDAGVVKYLVADLPFKSGTDLGKIKLVDLSKACNAWWKYKWIPESAKILWDNLDRSRIETPNPHAASPRRCWQHQTPNTLQQSSPYLVNIAIVLGLDENIREVMDRELRLQVQNIVWNSNQDAHLKTSVDFLHTIEDMRRKELKAMFNYFFDKLVHLSKPHLYPKNVEHVRDKLKDEMDVDFYEPWYDKDNAARLKTCSVYEFVAKIEGILMDSHETRTRETHESGHPGHKMVNGPNKPRDGPIVDWVAVGLAAYKGTTSAGKNIVSLFTNKGSREAKWNEELEQMLNGAHSHIQKSQESLVNDLIKRRNDALESWKVMLGQGGEAV